MKLITFVRLLQPPFNLLLFNPYIFVIILHRNILNTNLSKKFDVRKSVHHHTIRINQPTRCNSFINLLLDVYAWLNMFWAPLRPSSGEYNCTRSLYFYRWSVAVEALLVVVCQTTTNNAPTVKPDVPTAVVELLMMGREALETC